MPTRSHQSNRIDPSTGQPYPAIRTTPSFNDGQPQHLMSLARAQQLNYSVAMLNILRSALREAKRLIEQGSRAATFQYPAGYVWYLPPNLATVEQYLVSRALTRPEPPLHALIGGRPSEHRIWRYRLPPVGGVGQKVVVDLLQDLDKMRHMELREHDMEQHLEHQIILGYPRRLAAFMRALEVWLEVNAAYLERMHLTAVNEGWNFTNEQDVVELIRLLRGENERTGGQITGMQNTNLCWKWLRGGNVRDDIVTLHRMICTNWRPWVVRCYEHLRDWNNLINQGVTTGAQPHPVLVDPDSDPEDDEEGDVEMIDAEGDEFENLEEEEEETEN